MSESKYEGPGWYAIDGVPMRWVVGEVPETFGDDGEQFAYVAAFDGLLYRGAITSRRLGTDPNVEPQPLRIEAGKWYLCGDHKERLVGMVTNKTRSGKWCVRLNENNGDASGTFLCDDDGMSISKSWRILGPHHGPLPWDADAKGGAT